MREPVGLNQLARLSGDPLRTRHFHCWTQTFLAAVAFGMTLPTGASEMNAPITLWTKPNEASQPEFYNVRLGPEQCWQFYGFDFTANGQFSLEIFTAPLAPQMIGNGPLVQAIQSPFSITSRPSHQELQVAAGFPTGFAAKRRPVLSRFGVLAPELSDDLSLPKHRLSNLPIAPAPKENSQTSLRTSLESPPPAIPAPLQFEGNGGRGVKTWLSESHVLEINPRWMDFSLFESMDLNMTEKPLGPGQYEPQLWRSAFTVGMGMDWQIARSLGLQAGYRFFDNPMPDTIRSGAFPNASQHVIAMAMTWSTGAHSMTLTYGLDFLVADSGTAISSLRQGEDINPLAHLVTFAYRYSF